MTVAKDLEGRTSNRVAGRVAEYAQVQLVLNINGREGGCGCIAVRA